MIIKKTLEQKLILKVTSENGITIVKLIDNLSMAMDEDQMKSLLRVAEGNDKHTERTGEHGMGFLLLKAAILNMDENDDNKKKQNSFKIFTTRDEETNLTISVCRYKNEDKKYHYYIGNAQMRNNDDESIKAITYYLSAKCNLVPEFKYDPNERTHRDLLAKTYGTVIEFRTTKDFGDINHYFEKDIMPQLNTRYKPKENTKINIFVNGKEYHIKHKQYVNPDENISVILEKSGNELITKNIKLTGAEASVDELNQLKKF